MAAVLVNAVVEQQIKRRLLWLLLDHRLEEVTIAASSRLGLTRFAGVARHGPLCAVSHAE